LKIAPAFYRVTRQVQLIEKRAKLGPFFPSYGRGHTYQSKFKKKQYLNSEKSVTEDSATENR
jgi:hypothetical protein